jgi:NADH:ubiquinone oxidoreductase subunit K
MLFIRVNIVDWYVNNLLILHATLIDPIFFIFISFFIYFCGLISFIRNEFDILKSFLSLELLFLSCSFNFIIFSYFIENIYGQIYGLFVLTLAAIDSAIGLSLIIFRFRILGNIFVKYVNLASV